MEEQVEYKTYSTFEKNLDVVLGELKQFLMDKNDKYGDSYSNPLNVLVDLSQEQRILSRIEEKIARIVAGSKDEDTLKDIVGLWIHLQIIS